MILLMIYKGKLMKKILSLLFIVSIICSVGGQDSFAQTQTINQNFEPAVNAAKAADDAKRIKQGWKILHAKANPYWDKLRRRQGNTIEKLKEHEERTSWINKHVDLEITGLVYHNSGFGISVTRSIYPDRLKGWKVVDTVKVSMEILAQVGNQIGNIFLFQFFPYLSIHGVSSKKYVNVRHKQTYLEALYASPFEFKTMPVKAADISKVEIGELISTVTTGGLNVRAGGSIFDIIGHSLEQDVSIGPTAKIHIYKHFKMTMAKESENIVLIMLEENNDRGFGTGFRFGISFEDVIDVPITIGINRSSGYSPLRLNYKTKREKIKSLVFRINIATEKGRKAYEQAWMSDLTLLDDFSFKKTFVHDPDSNVGEELANAEMEPVIKELVRQSDVYTEEFNVGLDLIFYRFGYRNVTKDGKHTTKLASGEIYKYYQVIIKSLP